MTETVSFRNHLAEAFRMNNAPTLVSKGLRNSTISVTELRCAEPRFGMTAPIPIDDSYLIGLQLLPCLDHDLYFDGRFVQPTNWFAGAVTIYDLRHSPIADIRDPYHCVMYRLPHAALAAVADELGAARPDELRHRPGRGIDDPTVRHLLSSLIPAIEVPSQAPAMFLEHVSIALTTHIAHVYGGLPKRPGCQRGGLTRRQEHLAKDFMLSLIDHDVTLSQIAATCGVSVRHFTRAFRQTTGLTPHRWLMQQRIERARSLLGDHRRSLAEISVECGFVDQSHFTRSFVAATGISPGVWRRMRGFGRERVASPGPKEG